MLGGGGPKEKRPQPEREGEPSSGGGGGVQPAGGGTSQEVGGCNHQVTRQQEGNGAGRGGVGVLRAAGVDAFGDRALEG